MNDKRLKLLNEGPVTKSILVMSLPVVMGMMIQVLYNLVDTFFIGKLDDPNQLAAANIATPIFMILMSLAGVVGTGAASYISRCLGEKNNEQADKTLTIGIGLCIMLGLVMMIAGILFIKPLITILGASDWTFKYTYDYTFILLIGSIPIMCNYAMGQLLRSEGDAMGSMVGMLAGTVVNIVLDPIFIFTLGLETKGAAIATVLGNTSALLYYCYRYASGKTLLKVKPSSFTFDKIIYKEIFVIGIPSSLNQLLVSVAMIICNNIAASYSDIVVAGLGVASKIITIGTFIFMGFAAGCQPLVGFNYGAKNFERVRAIIKQGILITSVIGVTLCVLFGIFAHYLIAFFIPSPEVVDAGTTILRALMLSLPFVGGYMICTTTIQAMGKALPGLFLSISRQGIFYMPMLIVLNKIFGFNGFIYAQPITDVLMVVISVFILRKIIIKDHKLDQSKAKNEMIHEEQMLNPVFEGK
jgi:multidrug efflux pump